MNTKNCATSLVVALGLVVVSSVAIAANEKSTGPVVAPTHVVVAMSVSAPAPLPNPSSPFELLPMEVPDPDAARWLAMKDQVFSARPDFIAGLKQMELRIGDQLGELKTERAAMKSVTGVKRLDLAIKELGYARSYMKYMGEELTKATSENWSLQKARVGEAWARTQEFYAMRNPD